METRNLIGLVYVLFIMFSVMFITFPTAFFYAVKLENIAALLWTSNVAWLIVVGVCIKVLHKYLNT